MNSRASGVAGERLHGERTFPNRAASCAKVLVLAGVQNCGMAALLDRLLHHTHILKCGPRSWRTKVHTSLPTHDAVK